MPKAGMCWPVHMHVWMQACECRFHVTLADDLHREEMKKMMEKLDLIIFNHLFKSTSRNSLALISNIHSPLRALHVVGSSSNFELLE